MGLSNSHDASQHDDDFMSQVKKYIDEQRETGHEECNKRHKALETAYEELYQRHEALLQRSLQVEKVSSKISDEAIEKFVSNLINDPKTNIKWLPDSAESVMYNKVLKTLLHALGHAIDSAEIHFLGHKIKLTIEPEGETQSEGAKDLIANDDTDEEDLPEMV